MAEQFFDEGAFLRLAQLKQGKIQFTDATNAVRLLQEHGRDVRYNAPWKKWLVWNGSYWQVDESGALIHEKGLTMVRNIYDELLKTADYREWNAWKLRNTPS